MKSKLIAGSLLAALFGATGMSPAMAQNTDTPNIDRSQQDISARIQQGLASGHISTAEAQSLRQRERDIQNRENRYKADGYASSDERQQLREDLEGLRAEVERIMAQPRIVQQQPSDNTPGIDRSQQEISVRIQQGLASGHITPSEAQSLQRREREIQVRENRYKADRDASPQERQQLRQDLAALRAEVERIIAQPRAVAQQPVTPGREYNIGGRIDEGVRSGQITARQASRLHRKERQIQRLEARFNRDGVITRQERRQLQSELLALQDDVEELMDDDRR